MTATGVAPDTDAPASDPPARRPGWHRFGAATVPPLIALLAGWALLAIRSKQHGTALFNASTWARWDSGQYVRLARIGYFGSYHCKSGQVPPHHPPGPLFCGNTGWFPGYPAGIRGLTDVTSLSVPVAALIIAWACWYLVLVLMWQLLAGARSAASRWICLFIAAFFPGQVYFAALFPVSLCVAATLACLYLVTREVRRPLLHGAAGALAGAAAAYSYITPVAVAPALLITAVLAVRGRRRLQYVLGAVGIAAGFGGTLLTMQVMVGYWNGYFLSTAKYGVGAHSPIDTIGDRLSPLWETQPAGREFLAVTASQTLLTLLLVVLVTLATLIPAARRLPAAQPEAGADRFEADPADRRAADLADRSAVDSADRLAVDRSATDPADRVAVAQLEADPEEQNRLSWYPRFQSALAARVAPRDIAVLLAAGGVWLVPYIAGGQASTYRSEAFVVIAVPLLRRLPPWLLAIVLAAAVVTAWRMAPYFFNAKLI